MANIDFPSSPTLGQQYTFAGVVYTFTAQGVWSPSASVVATSGPQGRLTLQSNVPVMTSTVIGVTAVFYTPYVGNRIPIFDGVNMKMTSFTELTGSATDATKNPAIIGANKINDWFVWNDGGTICLGHGPDWTSDTARSAGTDLIRVNGILVNNAAITNGPAAKRGTYVGSTRSDAALHFQWILGSAALGGGPAVLGVWNCYNRVLATTSVTDSTNTWVYASTTPVPLNNGVGGGLGNRISFLSGIVEDIINANLFITMTATGATGIGGLVMDGTTTMESQAAVSISGAAAGVTGQCTRNYPGQLGFHFVQAMQAASGSITYSGGASATGLSAIFRM